MEFVLFRMNYLLPNCMTINLIFSKLAIVLPYAIAFFAA